MIDGALPPVYLDTSVLVAAGIGGLIHSGSCPEYCNRLVAAGTHVHFSQIVRLEFAAVIARLPRDTRLPEGLRREYRLGRWDQSPDVHERWMRFGARQLDALVGHFGQRTEAVFDRAVWLDSLDVMARHRLRSHDAIHVATARQAGVRTFATLDDDFRRVPDLDVRLLHDPR